MRNEEYLKILEQLDNSDRSTLLEVLPQKIDSSVLSRILNREIQPIKSSRDYCLGSYSSIYSKALPFMKSGSDKFNRGEVIYLSELISDFKGQESKLTELLRSANPDSSISNYS
jgi:hypothetical protein